MTIRIVDPSSLSPAPVVALPQGARIDGYDVECVVSRSEFAVVYRALDRATDQVVAVKEYLPVTLAQRNTRLRVVPRSIACGERFERGRRAFLAEAQTLQAFDHSSLVHVLGVVHAHGTACRVMRFAPGPTLLEHRRALGRLPAGEDFGRWFDGLLGAIGALHARARVHGAVAPANVLLRPGECPLLLGFGATRRVLEDDGTRGAASEHEARFRPVESVRPSPQCRIGPWTDLYGLAATLHYGLGGRVPDAAAHGGVAGRLEPFAEVWRRSAEGAPPPEELIPLFTALDTCLAAEPSDRPQSVGELRSRLGTAGSTQGMGLVAAVEAVAPTAARASRMPAAAAHEPPTATQGSPGSPAAWPTAAALEPQAWQLELALEPDLQLALKLEPEASVDTADTVDKADNADSASSADAADTANAGAADAVDASAEAETVRSPFRGPDAPVARSAAAAAGTVAIPDSMRVADSAPLRTPPASRGSSGGPSRPATHEHRWRPPSGGPKPWGAWVAAHPSSWLQAAMAAVLVLAVLLVPRGWLEVRPTDGSTTVSQHVPTVQPPLRSAAQGVGQPHGVAQPPDPGPAAPAARVPWEHIWELPLAPWTGTPAPPRATMPAIRTAEALRPPETARPLEPLGPLGPLGSPRGSAVQAPEDAATAATAAAAGPVAPSLPSPSSPSAGRAATPPAVATPSTKMPAAVRAIAPVPAPPQRNAQSATKARAAPAQAAPTTVGATAPRQSCRGRTAFALYQCMQLACAKPGWSDHAQCEQLRHSDGVQ